MSLSCWKRNGWLFLLGSLCAVGPLSIDMYLPAIPAIANNFRVSESIVQLSVVSYLVGMLIGQLVFGIISDQIGRKRPLYLGLLLYVVASTMCIITHSSTVFIAMRLVQGLGGCAGMVIARAVVRDRTVGIDSARAFSMLMLVVSVAPLLSPLAGAALLHEYGWRVLFVVMASFGASCLVAVHYTMHETVVLRERSAMSWRKAFTGFVTLLRCQTFMTYTLCNGLAQGAMYAYITGSPFVLIELYKLSPQAYSGLFALGSLGMIAASQINARLVAHFPLDTIIHWSALALAMLGLGGLLTPADELGPLSLGAGVFLCLTCLGFIAPNCAACALENQGSRAGIASALLGTILFAVGAFCGAAVAIFHDASARPLVCVMAACGISSFIVHRIAVQKNQP